MTIWEKALWTVGGIALMGCLLTAWDGVINVYVVEKEAGGHHFHFVVPGILAPVTLRLIPARYFHDAGNQVRPWLPVIRATSDALAEIPNTVLVEVADPHSHVVVRTHSHSLVADVNDDEEDVHVSIPIRVLRGSMEIIADKQAE
jgi:hypothetical protein